MLLVGSPGCACVGAVFDGMGTAVHIQQQSGLLLDLELLRRVPAAAGQPGLHLRTSGMLFKRHPEQLCVDKNRQAVCWGHRVSVCRQSLSSDWAARLLLSVWSLLAPGQLLLLHTPRRRPGKP